MVVLKNPQKKQIKYSSQRSKKNHETLRDSVTRTMQNYLAHIDGQIITNVYDMVLSEIEPPLLEIIMDYVEGNQSLAATVLGLNRGTLRKKLKKHGLLDQKKSPDPSVEKPIQDNNHI